MLQPLLLLIGLLSSIAYSSTFTPARPPSLPLAVKSPYLSTWLRAGADGVNGGYLPGQWPSFYTGQSTGWTGLIRIDNTTYCWMGKPDAFSTVEQVAAEYTSTKTIFTLEVDNKVRMKVTFLSPLTPHDLPRQSLIFSYMQVEVSSMSPNRNYRVQLYTDISAEWVSGDTEAVAQWDYGTSDDVAYHRVWKKEQQPYTEIRDRAEWGNWYYATGAHAGLTHQSGSDTRVRFDFHVKGRLANSTDSNFRAIGDDWPVFGYAIDLGTIQAPDPPRSTLFTIGLCQDNAIQFLGKEAVQLPSLWKSYFRNDLEALRFFHNDHPEMERLSANLDLKVADQSVKAAGQDYLVLTSLAARQAFGATQLVGSGDRTYLFLKEISSNGNTQTIDVIYPASPMFLYMNPELVRLLLEPHFENQEAGHYPHRWAVHDLGTHYPNATGHSRGDDEAMPLEECGNIIIMVLAYVQRSGNINFIKEHYPILKQWTEYLVEDSLYPAWQLSTDDFAGQMENQTNLALKGMIGLEAMSKIAHLVGEQGDSQNYTNIAQDYMSKWLALGINNDANPPHASITYNNASTYGLLYNLYNDRLVDTRIVPQEVYDIQSNFYPTVSEEYGVPLDTRNRWYTKGDWEVFCAAVASEETRDMFISKLAKWVKETTTNLPFTDLYETNTGKFPAESAVFKARPVMGGMFAILALQYRE